MSVFEYSTRQTRLNETFKIFTDLQVKIEELDNSDIILQEGEDVENRFYAVLSKLSEKISSLTLSQGSLRPVSNTVNHSPAVQLPKIDVPTFTGNPVDWISFFELFQTLIIDNSQLTDIQRFMYLKSYLRNEPLNLISTLQLTNDNFQIAIDTLQKRYANKTLLVNTHIKVLMELSSLSKSSSQNLREFLTRSKQNLDALSILLSKEEQYELFIIYLLEQKLDFNTRKEFESHRNLTHLPTLDEFFNFIENKCVTLENLHPEFLQSVSRPRTSHLSHVGREWKNGSDQNASIVANHQGSQITLHCVYCNANNHKVYKCERFIALPTPERFNVARNKNLCKNCLGTRHKVENCMSRRCYICSGLHHTLLHNNTQNAQHSNAHQNRSVGSSRQDFQRQNANRSHDLNTHNSPRNQNRDVVRNTVSDAESSEEQPRNTGVSAFSSQDSEVLLATAMVTIFSADQQPVQVKVLFDPGSQVSIVSERLIKKLNLIPFKKDFQISGIAEHHTVSNKMINLDIFSNISPHFSVNVSCVVLDKITCQLPQAQSSNNLLMYQKILALLIQNSFNHQWWIYCSVQMSTIQYYWTVW